MTNILNPQSKVPALNVPLIGGGQFNMAEASPENFQIIVFFRGLHCPKCKQQLEDINGKAKDLSSRGYDVVAISMDSEERAKQTAEEWDIGNIPLGYELSLMTAKSYGLFISDGRPDSKEPKIFSEPGLFVVKPDGTLYAEYLQNTPFGRPPISEIANGLDFVVKNNYPIRGTSVA